MNITACGVDTIDIGQKNCSKGIAILEFAKKRKIDEFLAIGDSENDIPMFEIANQAMTADQNIGSAADAFQQEYEKRRHANFIEFS